MNDKKTQMLWKDKMLRTLREWFDAALECRKEDTETFKKITTASFKWSEGQFAETLGYMTGYCDQATLDKVISLFNVEHPIFGKTLPGPDKAFAMGVALGKQLKDKKS